jgi:hypothetical protein
MRARCFILHTSATFVKHDIHLLHHSETSINKGISGEGLPFT